MAKDLDAIVPKYLLENAKNQELPLGGDDGNRLLNLLEVQREMLNNFDLVDFLDDDSWPVEYAASQMHQHPTLHGQDDLSDRDNYESVTPLDDDLYQMQELRRFGPIINF